MMINDCELKRQIAGAQYNEKQLKHLVLTFKSHIKSQRRTDSIKSVPDLIGILERRDVLDLKMLQDIAAYLHYAPKCKPPQNCPRPNITEREDGKS